MIIYLYRSQLLHFCRFYQVAPPTLFTLRLPVRSPTVGPWLIHQSGQSASSLSRPEASSPNRRGQGPLSGTPSKTTETHGGARLAELVKAVMVLGTHTEISLRG